MKKKELLAVLALLSLGLSGCNNASQHMEQSGINETVQNVQETDKEFFAESKEIAERYQKIYEQAVNDDTLGTLETVKKIVECLGDAGYAAVDDKNQIDMVNSDKVMEFVGKVENKEEAELTIICVADNGGFVRFDLQTAEGEVHVTRSYLSWNGKTPEINSKEEYRAYTWNYSAEGYLFFEQYHMSGYDGASGHTALRVQHLDEKCRELNRQYMLPIGYELNNLFILDWSENDFGELDFYDLFDILYQKVYKQFMPYGASDNCGIGAVYHVPGDEFENVIMSYFKIDGKTLQSKTKFFADDQSYEYRPRGLYDCEPPSIPYPEVVDYSENEDGTITLTVNVVYPDENLSKVFAHQVVIRPFSDGSFQYVSNHAIPSEDNHGESWHVDRLTEEEWEENYGELE